METVDDAPCEALRGRLQPGVPKHVEECRDNEFHGKLRFPRIGHVGRHLLFTSPDADTLKIGGEGGVEIVGGGGCLLRDEFGDVGERADAAVDIRHWNLLLKRKRFPIGHGLRAAGSRIAKRPAQPAMGVTIFLGGHLHCRPGATPDPPKKMVGPRRP